MAIKQIFESLFGKSKRQKQNMEQAAVLLQKICSSMGELKNKAAALNDESKKERETIAELNSTVKTIKPSTEITAAKFETDILGKITEVSSAWDTVLSGGNSEGLKKTLSSLEFQVKQRMSLHS